MEAYAAAMMEYTPRTRFLITVCALEALSDQLEPYDAAVVSLIERLGKEFEERAKEVISDKSLRDSLRGRIRDLQRNSVHRSLKRTVFTYLDGVEAKDAWKFIDKQAYPARCDIVHDGTTRENLSELTRELQSILRRVYSVILGLPLQRQRK
jgi:hypothetical protein